MKCKIGFEVSRTAAGRTRSIVFTTKRAAQKFKHDNPGSAITPVELCTGTGKIRRRGKRSY